MVSLQDQCDYADFSLHFVWERSVGFIFFVRFYNNPDVLCSIQQIGNVLYEKLFFILKQQFTR